MKALLLVVLLAGCGATAPTVKWDPEAALLTLCPATLPMLDGGNGKAILPWGIEARKEYEGCAARHKRLVESIPK